MASEWTWSDEVDRAAWLGDELAPFASCVGAVVPRCFEVYARILHPAETPEYGDKLVRWHEVAEWSKTPIVRDSQFHSIALPQQPPDDPAPWRSQGPATGSLYVPDALALADILREATTTPGECLFCVWEGYGWGSAALWNGRRVELPNRRYLLYEGPIDAVTAVVEPGNGQTPNLWWPSDRTWCVASEIDLPYTYVGASSPVIEEILSDARLEAVPAGPEDPLTRVEPWIEQQVRAMVDELLRSGQASLATTRGTITAFLVRSWHNRSRRLHVSYTGANGVSGDGSASLSRDDPAMRKQLEFYLIRYVIGLVEL